MVLETGLKKKTKTCRRETKWVGHLMSKHGLKPCVENKAEAIGRLNLPENKQKKFITWDRNKVFEPEICQNIRTGFDKY